MDSTNLYKYKFEVTRVVDGDTVDGWVDLGFQMRMFKRVRLFGIDAPESRTLDLEEKARGISAGVWLTEKLQAAHNQVILATEKDETGKYGRLLGTIIIDDININELMISEGHAVPYT